ncbi:hypothetical protein C0J52_21713 [Blattella germanica]|nr:hypothetical protein C0J52_21713 [Blattella germanica]
MKRRTDKPSKFRGGKRPTSDHPIHLPVWQNYFSKAFELYQRSALALREPLSSRATHVRLEFGDDNVGDTFEFESSMRQSSFATVVSSSVDTSKTSNLA